MFKNYFLVALRNIKKKKIYSAINILGLATGMAVCMLIVLFIKSETGYDTFHSNAGNIYRMVVERIYPGRTTYYSFIPQSYAAAAKQEFPEVKESVRVFDFLGGNNMQVKVGDKKFEEKRVLVADSNFFRVFSANFIAGNLTDALSKPNSVVLNETTAAKYFGTAEAAFNKTILPEGNNAEPLLVTAVFKDWPEQAHFHFDLLLTTAGNRFVNNENYVNFAAHTYLLLNEKASAQQVQAKLPILVEKYAKNNIEKQFAQSYNSFKAAGNGYIYSLQPLTQIHLTSKMEGELEANGSLQAVYIFSIVALFILIIAGINFINLSTARSAERAKEVGIRKTFGSEKKSLVLQFLAESVLISTISMLLAAGLIYLLIPLFNQISAKELSIGMILTAPNIMLLVGFTLFTGLLAGLYPAFVLSSFKPITVLRGKFKSGNYGLALRNGLVVFQFAVSVILIVCTVVVNSQMNYMTSEKLGFNKENTIIIERTNLLQENTRAFKNELMKVAGVEKVSGTSSLPGQANFFGTSWQVMGKQDMVTGRGIITDANYQNALGIEMLQGRFFSDDFATDSLAVVINQKSAEAFGLTNPIGTRITSPDEFYNAPDGSTYVYTIIGVVKDFHYQSLHQPIAPLMFVNAKKFNDISFTTAVRIKADNFNASVKSIEAVWDKFIKEQPFHYAFLDKTVAQQYHAEARMQKIFTFFSSLAIFIACIGLLGLAAYATQQRTREISIRKVLGASSTGIVQLLSKQFAKLVVIAILIAFPVAWFAMNKWLQDFTYRIHLAWWMFVAAGGAALLIALLTISFQAIKAALANPVKSLRTE
ncbi:MAG: ABC transporter permease [Chitinophagaceae bacterium]|nr:ABC transporter permease [Chitinophagaceae bacterium]